LKREEWDFDHFVEEKRGRWDGRKAADEGFHRRPSIDGRPAVGDGDVC